VGETSGYLGATSIFVTTRLLVNPIENSGWNRRRARLGFWRERGRGRLLGNPRHLLSVAVTDGSGSFTGTGASKITIPANAPPGVNGVVVIGQTTGAIATGSILVE